MPDIKNFLVQFAYYIMFKKSDPIYRVFSLNKKGKSLSEAMRGKS